MSLKKWDRGEKVLSVQKDLLRCDYPLPRSTRKDGSLDGIVGDEVMGAARLFEQDRHLPVSPNGTISSGTIEALKEAIPYLRGLDVSHHQGQIDWKKVAEAGYRWVYLKATEGRTYTDPTFSRNFREAQGAHLRVGAYHYWWPERDPLVQARHFREKAGPLGLGYLPPCLDVEMDNGLSAKELNSRLQALIDATRELFGRIPVIYSSKRVYEEWGLTVGGECPFWMVRWGRDPLLAPPWNDWTLWQTGPASGVPGIPGKVDRDLFHGGEAEMRRFIGLGGC